jgi:hypothetical protein
MGTSGGKLVCLDLARGRVCSPSSDTYTAVRLPCADQSLSAVAGGGHGPK